MNHPLQTSVPASYIDFSFPLLSAWSISNIECDCGVVYASAQTDLAHRAYLLESWLFPPISCAARSIPHLRQPLQALALLNGALRRMVKDPEPAKALLQQEHAIGAMSRLLNALIDISKLESGAIKPEVTDFTVTEIFAEARNELASLAEEKGLQLKVESCTACVQSDPSLVEQVLRNLVSNAIKYTRHGFVQLRCLHVATDLRTILMTGDTSSVVRNLPHDERLRITSKPVDADELLSIVRELSIA